MREVKKKTIRVDNISGYAVLINLRIEFYISFKNIIKLFISFKRSNIQAVTISI